MKEKNNNINLLSEFFRQNLYNLINESNLPISNIYYIMSLLQKQVELNYYASLNSESPETELSPQVEQKKELGSQVEQKE